MINIKNRYKHSKAFSMMTAVFVILIISALGGFIINLAGKLVDETTAQYRKEQAILYAKSYTEFAIMSATARNCISRIEANVGGNSVTTEDDVRAGLGYKVDVEIQYIGNDLGGGCPTIGGSIDYERSRGAIIIVDTYVRYRNPEHPNAISKLAFSQESPGYLYHRRTLQRL